MDQIAEAQATDEMVVEAQQLVIAGKATPYTWKDGVMLCQDRVYVPLGSNQSDESFYEAHLSAYAMHPGETEVYKTLRPHYWWPGMV